MAGWKDPSDCCNDCIRFVIFPCFVVFVFLFFNFTVRFRFQVYLNRLNINGLSLSSHKMMWILKLVLCFTPIILVMIDGISATATCDLCATWLFSVKSKFSWRTGILAVSDLWSFWFWLSSFRNGHRQAGRSLRHSSLDSKERRELLPGFDLWSSNFDLWSLIPGFQP